MPKTGVPVNQESGVCRQKYWSELDLGEKVERIREVVKALSRELERLERIVRDLRGHKHTEDRKVVVEKEIGGFSGEGESSAPPAENKDQVYF